MSNAWFHLNHICVMYVYIYRLIMNNVWRELLFEGIEREFVKERRLARKEFEDRNHELTETLIAELNERKKAIEHDNLTMELCM